jgi:hypothetical protein
MTTKKNELSWFTFFFCSGKKKHHLFNEDAKMLSIDARVVIQSHLQKALQELLAYNDYEAAKYTLLLCENVYTASLYVPEEKPKEPSAEESKE